MPKKKIDKIYFKVYLPGKLIFLWSPDLAMSGNGIKENRKEEIFTAAVRCFNENGYYRTSMDSISERAGITKRGLYYHFKSKDELFIELFHHRGKKYFEQINTFIRDIDDPEERMRLFVREGSQILEENEDFLKFFIEFMSIGARKPEVRKVMTEHYKDSINNFKQLLSYC